MYSCITSYGISGIDAYAVAVEVTINRAMPMFDIVGLPDAAVRESRSRVQSTIIHGGYEMPVARKNPGLRLTCPSFLPSCPPLDRLNRSIRRRPLWEN